MATNALGIPLIPVNKYPVPSVTELLAIAKKELGSSRRILHSPEFRSFAEKFGDPSEQRRVKALYALNIAEAVLMNFSSPLGAGLAAIGMYDQATNLFRDELGKRGLTITARPAVVPYDPQKGRSNFFYQAIRNLGRGRKDKPDDYDFY
ncbi:MAG: hypothetical protein SFW65_05975 [Alphaproteobacteria bacterium]|nr:hypothetical protein [Alphaproteobacteria bacterium]